MTCIKRAPAHAVAASSLAWLALVAAGAASAQTGPQPRLATVDLRAGMHVIKAELAVTAEQQMTGMMFRQTMSGNEGMLFVNDEKSARCFWMKNTLVPLTIAFIADDGTIVNLADMQPHDERSHCSKAPVRFALEMPRGWFDKRGIKAGFKLSGPPFVAGAAGGAPR
ncbi:MAG: DUF192 domain-containing protein [Betaproteobacteria bacterium]|nr:DUF192 domain-containing protein [Betaproteobacteria bacterium]MCC6249671.1 DUF192 domain-containing protein [Rubrivivax sp.]MCL4700134.1 DUF192 domain-containing protein [Burkholderiaceae bacterium]